MILDAIENLQHYETINPLFGVVAKFLQQNDLSTLPTGRMEICGEDLYVNIVDAQPKSAEEAILETHRMMVDIQIPISGTEQHGYAPLSCLDKAPYQEQDDIAFHHNKPHTYLQIHPGEFVIYFPQDGHAPAITPTVLRKAIFKVKNQK